jgi:hypothetical protein
VRDVAGASCQSATAAYKGCWPGSGPCRYACVRGDVAAMPCSGGHAAEGPRHVAAVQAAHTTGWLGARKAHAR